MPNGNKTGPLGMGPLTGRGTGHCAGSGVAGCDNRPGGRRMGMGGRGRARGRGQGFRGGMSGRQGRGMGAAVIDDAQELATLKEQVGHLEEALDDIRQRMDELQKNDAE
jgi:hypothetical protein